MVHESETRSSTHFITLTYDEKHLPEAGSLNPRDTKNFIKALRKRTGPLSYYLCGEYGSKKDRPHYHAVLYGADLSDRHLYTHRNSQPVWHSPLLAESWTLGSHEFTNFNYAAALYTSGYIRKKLSLKRHASHYERLNLLTGEIRQIQQEFARISNRPALGKRWFHQFSTDVYPRDFVLINGQKSKPPRYYDRLLEDGYLLDGVRTPGQPELMMQVRAQRYADAKELSEKELADAEVIHEARIDLYSPRNAND